MSDDVLVVIIMGSASDRAHADQIRTALDRLEIPSISRIASAHKTPAHLLEILAGYEASPLPKVYITIAGRSNALSGMVDANVLGPVIACPPLGSSFQTEDVFSSLRMPSGTAPLLVLEPGNAALAAAKMLALRHAPIAERLAAARRQMSEGLLADDAALQEALAASGGGH